MKIHHTITIFTLLSIIGWTNWGENNTIFAAVVKPQISRVLNISSYDTCVHLKEAQYLKPQNPNDARKQYDTLRLYIEKCAKNDNDSYVVFSALSAAVGRLSSSDSDRYVIYRNWLISVLYLNTAEPGYYCACLASVAGTYDGVNGHFINAGLAVIKYLLSLPNCYGKALQKQYDESIKSRIESGKDTTIPPLDSIGLGFLLTHNSVSPSTPLPTIYLASFTSSPNPFKNETTLSFELNRMAYVTVEVFDPLGRKVWGDDHGYSLDKGIHTVHLDAAKLSSGTYYARISTGFGEVKTVKIIKE